MKGFRQSGSATLSLLVLTVLFAGGCTGMGAKQLRADRFDYGAAIGDSLKAQTLTNIVKLRYAEWPTFLEVNQLATSYTVDKSVSAKFIQKTWFLGDNDQLEAGGLYRLQERPTVLYKPLSGPKFVKSILSPPSPAALFALIQTGWPADMILRMTVQSVNGHQNSYVQIGTGHRTEPGFARFVKLIRRAQLTQALVVDISKAEGKARITLGFRKRLLDEEALRDLKEVQKLIGLDPAADSYQVIWDVESSDPGKLAVQTRSIIQIMMALAVYVETRPGDVESGRVVRLDPLPEEDESGLRTLMKVRSGTSEPQDAYVAVPYRGGWFWIEDTDAYSKRTLAYLQMLLSITESDEKGGAQLVITTN
jgi:hypothetical protein